MGKECEWIGESIGQRQQPHHFPGRVLVSLDSRFKYWSYDDDVYRDKGSHDVLFL